MTADVSPAAMAECARRTAHRGGGGGDIRPSSTEVAIRLPSSGHLSAGAPGQRNGVGGVELIGREDLLGEVTARVAKHGRRLVSLIGPGGIGKTTLARAAHGALAGPAAATLVVELARIEDGGAVPGAIAAHRRHEVSRW